MGMKEENWDVFTRPYDLRDRLFEFACVIVRLVQYLQTKDAVARSLSREAKNQSSRVEGGAVPPSRLALDRLFGSGARSRHPRNAGAQTNHGFAGPKDRTSREAPTVVRPEALRIVWRFALKAFLAFRLLSFRPLGIGNWELGIGNWELSS